MWLRRTRLVPRSQLASAFPDRFSSPTWSLRLRVVGRQRRARRGPLEALPTAKSQRASRLRGASQVEPPHNQLVATSTKRRPWRPAASCGPRSAFGTRIRDAERMPLLPCRRNLRGAWACTSVNYGVTHYRSSSIGPDCLPVRNVIDLANAHCSVSDIQGNLTALEAVTSIFRK